MQKVSRQRALRLLAPALVQQRVLRLRVLALAHQRALRLLVRPTSCHRPLKQLLVVAAQTTRKSLGAVLAASKCVAPGRVLSALTVCASCAGQKRSSIIGILIAACAALTRVLVLDRCLKTELPIV